MDRITVGACDPSGLHVFYVKVNTCTGSEVGVVLSELFPQGDIDSVARDVGDRLCFLPLLILQKSLQQ